MLAMKDEPVLALRLLESLSRRVRTLIQRLDARVMTTITSAVAATILDAAAAAKESPFRLGVTHAELALELGTVRELIVRALRDLRSAGAISSSGRGLYSILDRDLLERIARPSAGA